MGAKRRAADRAGRPAMRSPGRPSVGRLEHRQRFWAAIARGVLSEEAAAAAGVSAAVGVRWFGEGGGMPTVTLAAPSGRYLSFTEREEIAMLRAGGSGVREIAVQLGRSPSTISRELRRNAATRSGGFEYRATTAQWHADRRARRPKPAKLAVNAWVAAVCPGPPVRDGAASWRHRRRRSGSEMDRLASWSARGSALGTGLEPGTDLQPAAVGLSR
jgi:DNA-binding CsgD family transcriptional regulator